MSKGEQLDKLFKEAEELSAEMKQLFIKNNIAQLELNALPLADLVKWRELHNQHCSLGNQMCEIINPKKPQP